MADLSLVFDLLARDRASDKVNKVGDAMGRAGRESSLFGKAAGLAMAGAAAGAVAVGGLGVALWDMTKEAAESAKISRLTEAAVASTGGAAKISADQIGELAEALSNKTAIDDEAIQSASNLLLTFTNVRNEAGAGNDIFNQATEAALNMSTAMGTDANAAAMQLGKALNDPIKGVAALGKAGVQFTKEQKEQIATMVESGNVMGAQRMILGELSTQFGGAAAAAADPMERLSTIAGNLGEQVGGALLPHVERFATYLTDHGVPAVEGLIEKFETYLPPAIDAGMRAFGEARDFAADIVEAIQTGDWSAVGGAVEDALGTVLEHLPGLATKLFGALAGVIGEVDWFGLAMKLGEQVPTLLTGLAVGILNFDLGSLLQGLADNWFSVLMGVLGLALAPAKVVGKVGELLAKIPLVGRFLQWLLDGAKGLIDGAVGMAGSVIAGFARGFTGGGPGIIGAVRRVFDSITSTLSGWGSGIVGWFGGLPGRLVGAAEWLGGALRGLFDRAARAMLDALRAGASAANDLMGGIPGRILGALGNLGSLLFRAGGDIMDGLVRGLKAAWKAVKDTLGALTDMLPDWKGPAERDRTILYDSGVMVMQGFENGLTSKFGDINGTLGAFTDGLGASAAVDVTGGANLSGGLGYAAPRYDMPTGGAGATAAPTSRTVNVSGVASPEVVAAIVRREQAVDEFLAGV